MPPIPTNIYYPKYRLDYLITKKSYTEKRSQRSIRAEIAALLQISMEVLWKLRRVEIGDDYSMKVDDLVKLVDYFECQYEDIISQDLQASNSNESASGVSNTEADNSSSFVTDL